MAKNFPNLIEDINLQILNVQWTPDKGKTKKKKKTQTHSGLFLADFILVTQSSFSQPF